jgi:hypothetical protein
LLLRCIVYFGVLELSFLGGVQGDIALAVTVTTIDGKTTYK